MSYRGMNLTISTTLESDSEQHVGREPDIRCKRELPVRQWREPTFKQSRIRSLCCGAEGSSEPKLTNAARCINVLFAVNGTIRLEILSKQTKFVILTKVRFQEMTLMLCSDTQKVLIRIPTASSQGSAIVFDGINGRRFGRSELTRSLQDLCKRIRGSFCDCTCDAASKVYSVRWHIGQGQIP